MSEVQHRQLIEMLAASGAVRTDAWRRAAGAVPRHEFLRGGFFRPVPGATPSAWAPVREGDDGWLDGCYTDDSLVTQIAGTIRPEDVRGEIMREPSSSSTRPSLVLRMLENLDVTDGSRVLEIGTGTGYSTALLCARLGEESVTSVEYDDEVAARAAGALGRLGMHPTLVTGDGLLGHTEGAPYDRIVATCGVRTVPGAWVTQTRPGGLILATVGGWLGSSELARLTVNDDGTASGRFLGGGVSFMLARPHLPPPLGLLPDLTAGKERETAVGADVLTDWTARFVVQQAVPRTQHLTLQQNGRTEHVLIDTESGSWASVYEDDSRWTVRHNGRELLWDAVEAAVVRWTNDGQPPLTQFTVTVTPDGQSINW
ncbi:ATP-grasp peptide maturase system methyltransferase [Streptomyces sp. NPDC058739]|uniref:ATP-grasp peptide maturase system methyltransferase n=1 Tax=Streptomyces sp. NPDC058739 TaxID=3346618 RepID=UPI0036A59725